MNWANYDNLNRGDSPKMGVIVREPHLKWPTNSGQNLSQESIEPHPIQLQPKPTLQGNLLQTGLEPSTGFVGFGGGEFASMLSSYVPCIWREFTYFFDASTLFRGFFGWGTGWKRIMKWLQRHHEKFFESHGLLSLGHPRLNRDELRCSKAFPNVMGRLLF